MVALQSGKTKKAAEENRIGEDVAGKPARPTEAASARESLQASDSKVKTEEAARAANLFQNQAQDQAQNAAGRTAMVRNAPLQAQDQRASGGIGMAQNAPIQAQNQQPPGMAGKVQNAELQVQNTPRPEVTGVQRIQNVRQDAPAAMMSRLTVQRLIAAEAAVIDFSKTTAEARAEVPTRKIAAKTFYRWAGYWIDGQCAGNPKAPFVSTSLENKAYQEIIGPHPALLEFVASGAPVLFYSDGKIYVIR